MPWEIKFDNLILGYLVTAGRPGEEVTVQDVEFASSEDGGHFITLLEGIPSQILQKISATPPIMPSSVDHMLVIVRPDKTCTAYINELKIIALMQTKRAANAGETIFKNDIADIREIRFEGIDIPNEYGVLYLFSIGWRKGMYYDFSPLRPNEGLKRTYDLNRKIAQFHLYLMFQDRFKISEETWNKMFTQGWFPFISLTQACIKNIINYANNSWCIDDALETISNEVKDGLPKWLGKWKRLAQFSDHFELLEKAVERFQNRDFISTVAILYPRIEGVMRSRHKSVSPNQNRKQKNLVTSTLSGVDPDLNPKLLLLPNKFSKYLDEVVFADFDPNNPKGLSRNTVSHGVADAAGFSEKSACIGFLILNQLTYYYS